MRKQNHNTETRSLNGRLIGVNWDPLKLETSANKNRVENVFPR